MKKGIKQLSAFAEAKGILQGTTTVTLGDFNYFHGLTQHAVLAAIQNLKEYLNLKDVPLVLAQQVHGTKISRVQHYPRKPVSFFQKTDALMTNQRKVLIGILTADCVPVFLYDQRQKVIALAHAGWRGVAKGLAPKCLKAMQKYYQTSAADILAGIGPYISREHFEVGRDATAALGIRARGKTKVDLGELVFRQLLTAGILEKNISQSILRTFTSPLFFSYRKHHEKAGRMLSFLLIK